MLIASMLGTVRPPLGYNHNESASKRLGWFINFDNYDFFESNTDAAAKGQTREIDAHCVTCRKLTRRATFGPRANAL
jgi:hypothetical protein